MTKTNLEIEEEYSVANFIKKYMNDHGQIRWLRGIFYDEGEKVATILEWMEGITKAQQAKLQQRMDEIEEAVKDIKAYREDSMEDRWVLLKEVLSIIKKTNE